jgi:hypothetical protein
MADVAKSTEDINRVGLAATYNTGLATDDNYQISNDGRLFLHIKKTGAGACIATAVTNTTVDGLAVPDKTVSIPATTGDKFWGPFPTSIYGTTLNVTFDEVTGLTFAALRIE